MDETTQHNRRLPLALGKHVDGVCDQFEQALRGGANVEFSTFLGKARLEARRALLAELCHLAIEHLQKEGVNDPTEEILKRNSALISELEPILATLSPASGHSGNGAVTVDHVPSPGMVTPSRKRSRGLRIRCPHCSNPVELVSDLPSDVVDCAACGSTFSLIERSRATHAAATLKRIDRFELISRLGIGGFGTVWKARDVDLDRIVAVKIPRYGQLEPREIEQFFKEAKAAAQLRHPNIVSVHEIGLEDDSVFIVSDLVRGVTLSDWLTAKTPTPQEAAELLIPIADALHHAHKHGVVHRDMKPSNIMIDEDGSPHLMDFGLAKRDIDEVAMTMDGQIVGTPSYMSPEQAEGKSAWVDRRSDIYSLGVILFEVLTGELPFRGNMQMQIHQRLTEEAPNARSLNSTLPIDIATICAKCLEREVGRRYATTEELREELQRFLDNRPIKARPVSRVERTIRWVQRNPMPAALAALVLFLAVAGPTAAIRIEMQKREIETRRAENAKLLVQDKKEDIENSKLVSDLVRQRDLLAGTTNPWSAIGIESGKAPKLVLVTEMLEVSGGDLEKVAKEQSTTITGKVYAHLTLALLKESIGQTQEALKHYSAVEQQMSIGDFREEKPELLALALSRKARLLSLNLEQLHSQRMNRDDLTKTILQIRRDLVQRNPGSIRALIQQMDSELLAAAAKGIKHAKDHFAAVQVISGKLKNLWPKDPKEAFKIAWLLSGGDQIDHLDNDPLPN